MKRRALLALGLLFPLPALSQPRPLAPALRPATLSAQDRSDIGRIEAYLNALRAMRARFLQVAPDGQVTEGNAWIQRPGRMRIEYDPPSPPRLVAGGGNGLV